MSKFLIAALLLLTACASTNPGYYGKPINGVAHFNSVASGAGQALTGSEERSMQKILTDFDQSNTERFPQRYFTNKDTIRLALALPDKLGELKSNGRVDSFEYSLNGLGYGKRYVADNSTQYITIYIYHARQRDIPTGIDNPIAEQEYRNSIEAITSAGIYGNFEVVKAADVPITIGKVRFNHFALLSEQDMYSEMYLTSVANTFVKVRTDYRPRDTIAMDRQLVFMRALAKFLERR